MGEVSTNRKVIWVTQTLPRGEASAAGFAALGLQPIVSPLLEVKPSTAKMKTPSPETHLIFTSRNGVRAFCQQHEDRGFPVICVGEATAQLAKDKGFKTVVSVNGTSKEIIAWVRGQVPRSTHLLHCAGQDTRGDIVKTLKEAGYTAEYRAYYRTQAVENIDVDLGEIDYVALYSPKAAQVFRGFLDPARDYGFTTLSISAATDAYLEGVAIKARLIAEKPTQSSLLARLQLDLHRD